MTPEKGGPGVEWGPKDEAVKEVLAMVKPAIDKTVFKLKKEILVQAPKKIDYNGAKALIETATMETATSAAVKASTVAKGSDLYKQAYDLKKELFVQTIAVFDCMYDKMDQVLNGSKGLALVRAPLTPYEKKQLGAEVGAWIYKEFSNRPEVLDIIKRTMEEVNVQAPAGKKKLPPEMMERLALRLTYVEEHHLAAYEGIMSAEKSALAAEQAAELAAKETAKLEAKRIGEQGLKAQAEREEGAQQRRKQNILSAVDKVFRKLNIKIEGNDQKAIAMDYINTIYKQIDGILTDKSLTEAEKKEVGSYVGKKFASTDADLIEAIKILASQPKSGISGGAKKIFNGITYSLKAYHQEVFAGVLEANEKTIKIQRDAEQGTKKTNPRVDTTRSDVPQTKAPKAKAVKESPYNKMVSGVIALLSGVFQANPQRIDSIASTVKEIEKIGNYFKEIIDLPIKDKARQEKLEKLLEDYDGYLTEKTKEKLSRDNAKNSDIVKAFTEITEKLVEAKSDTATIIEQNFAKLVKREITKSKRAKKGIRPAVEKINDIINAVKDAFKSLGHRKQESTIKNSPAWKAFTKERESPRRSR
jgi:hypothetical protein